MSVRVHNNALRLVSVCVCVVNCVGLCERVSKAPSLSHTVRVLKPTYHPSRAHAELHVCLCALGSLAQQAALLRGFPFALGSVGCSWRFPRLISLARASPRRRQSQLRLRLLLRLRLSSLSLRPRRRQHNSKRQLRSLPLRLQPSPRPRPHLRLSSLPPRLQPSRPLRQCPRQPSNLPPRLQPGLRPRLRRPSPPRLSRRCRERQR